MNNECISSNSKLLKEIIGMLLEDNQETAEYEFAFNILSMLNKNSIDIREFQELVQLRIKSVNNDLQFKITQIYAN